MVPKQAAAGRAKAAADQITDELLRAHESSDYVFARKDRDRGAPQDLLLRDPVPGPRSQGRSSAASSLTWDPQTGARSRSGTPRANMSDWQEADARAPDPVERALQHRGQGRRAIPSASGDAISRSSLRVARKARVVASSRARRPRARGMQQMWLPARLTAIEKDEKTELDRETSSRRAAPAVPTRSRSA